MNMVEHIAIRQQKTARAGVCLFCIALLWISASFWLRPDLLFFDQFLTGDAGYNLLDAREILAGKMLYRDIFSPYGPLATYLYAGFAACCGNTPQTYFGFVSSFTLLNVALLLFILGRVLDGWRLFLFTLFAMFPVFLNPGSITHGFCSIAYQNVERTLILLIVALWKPIGQRTSQRAYILGLILGTMQWAKFGNAFVAGAAIILVDLGFLARTGFSNANVLPWLRNSVLILAGFLSLEGLLAGVFFALLPQKIAADNLWPLYMLRNYAGLVKPVDRYPQWLGASYFLTRQLGILIALVLFSVTAWGYLIKRITTVPLTWSHESGRFVVLGLFYVLNVAVTFRAIWHFYGYAWMLTLAGAYIFRTLRPPWIVSVLIGWSFCLIINVKMLNPNDIPRDVALHELPLGGKLWLTERTNNCLQRVVASLKKLDDGYGDSKQTSLLMLPQLGGLYVYLQILPPVRNCWIMPGLVRPYDEPALLASLPKTRAVLVWDNYGMPLVPSSSSADWTQDLQISLSDACCRAVRQNLAEPIQIDEKCWVIPVKPTTSSITP